MSKHAPMPQSEVLAWLHEHHPQLHADAELERDWCWLSTDLRGDHNKATREAIKQFGFRFAKRGHPLPSGKEGRWGHSCTKPIPFHRKSGASNTHHKAEPVAAQSVAIDPEILSFFSK